MIITFIIKFLNPRVWVKIEVNYLSLSVQIWNELRMSKSLKLIKFSGIIFNTHNWRNIIMLFNYIY